MTHSRTVEKRLMAKRRDLDRLTQRPSILARARTWTTRSVNNFQHPIHWFVSIIAAIASALAISGVLS
jgi:hypothetical protein